MAETKITRNEVDNPDGWTPAPACSYSAANAILFAQGLITGKISVGMKIKLTNNSTVKYYTVTLIVTDGGSNNIVYLSGPVALVNSAITLPYYSMYDTPYAMPGAWISYTPSYSNLTVGNGTVVSKYTIIGKTVHIKYMITWGSTTAYTAGSNIEIGLPINAVDDFNKFGGVGNSSYYDLSVGNVISGTVVITSSTTMRPYANNSAATYTTINQVNNASPIIWATGDTMSIEATYEAV